MFALLGTVANAPARVSYGGLGVAACSFLIAVIFGVANRTTANKALHLSERGEARQLARIDIYLFDAIVLEEQDCEIRGFNVQLSNPADSPNTVTDAEVRLTYCLSGVVTTVGVRRRREHLPAVGLNGIVEPVRLDARAARTGWLLFEVPHELIAERDIERYDLITRDVRGLETTTQVVNFQALPDA